MSDLKSKLPDLQELTSMATKFFNAMKTGVCEIVDDYKQKRACNGTESCSTEKTVEKKTTKTAKKVGESDVEVSVTEVKEETKKE